MLKDQFSAYLKNTNAKSSGKANSYINAIDLVCRMIDHKAQGFEDCRNVWSTTSPERLQALYHFLIEQQKIGTSSPWVITGIAPSYLKNGFCSAAIRSYQEFLIEHNYQEDMLERFTSYRSDEAQLPKVLDRGFSYPDFLIEEKMKEEGRDVVRRVKTRLNQNIFRRMVLQVYDNTCCVSGLNIPELNRASHIIPWAKNKDTRMDPRNGLCLSATYDVAFDRHLISFDSDYRMILSKDIKDHYSSDTVKEYFHSNEGRKIDLPSNYRPKIEYLMEHCKQGYF